MTRGVEETVAALCQQLHTKALQFEETAQQRAEADVAYRQARAERILRAQVSGEATSVARAEYVADADKAIARLRLAYLSAEGVCEGLTKSMAALRTRIEFGRSRMSTERQADALMATSREVP